ncbi:MAG: tellurite methyltransferase [Methylophagaceae bacterium]|jgi:tellurite methyltransferase
MQLQSIQQKWDDIYQQQKAKPCVAEVLQHNHYLLPEQGVALDLACGLGANALMLAEKGLEVMAWDISPVAIESLKQNAIERGVVIDTQVRDVLVSPPKANSLDVLVVSLFLARELCPKLIAALRPGGLLFYQTYCQHKVSDGGPNNLDYLLEDNELLRLFPDLKLRVYREESLLGQYEMGMRNQAWMMAEKPAN